MNVNGLREILLASVRHSFYNHFCSGEDVPTAAKSILALSRAGLRNMLVYSSTTTPATATSTASFVPLTLADPRGAADGVGGRLNGRRRRRERESSSAHTATRCGKRGGCGEGVQPSTMRVASAASGRDLCLRRLPSRSLPCASPPLAPSASDLPPPPPFAPSASDLPPPPPLACSAVRHLRCLPSPGTV
ncbi:hypothetical protein Fmac_008414 [Flemingia macrophylla]|uniref:Proline dehydrogenase n=1 Tax=Flemingia macrophylla TaxID=520843 RepID=A0ABD1MXB6_9FABA